MRLRDKDSILFHFFFVLHFMFFSPYSWQWYMYAVVGLCLFTYSYHLKTYNSELGESHICRRVLGTSVLEDRSLKRSVSPLLETRLVHFFFFFAKSFGALFYFQLFLGIKWPYQRIFSELFLIILPLLFHVILYFSIFKILLCLLVC